MCESGVDTSNVAEEAAWNGGGGQDQSRHPGWHRHHGPQPVPGASGQYTTLQRSRHQEQ